jgi:hypothetical protein
MTDFVNIRKPIVCPTNGRNIGVVLSLCWRSSATKIEASRQDLDDKLGDVLEEVRDMAELYVDRQRNSLPAEFYEA